MLLLAGVTGCKKKKDAPVLSSQKQITSFILKAANNAGAISKDIYADIGRDSIILPLPEGTNLTHLIPHIGFAGVALNPESEIEQDFSHPVVYTVTAKDGSTKKYVVVVQPLSSEKRITAFVFKATDNVGLSEDITGIISHDTIVVRVPAEGNYTQLTPTITYKGAKLNPASNSPQNFTNTVTYQVTAEDGSSINYKVFISANTTVYINSSDGYLYALDAASGALLWKFYVGQTTQPYPPTFYNGLVYVSSYSGLYALDALTGKKVWTFAPSGSTLPIVSAGIVYGYTSSNGKQYLAAVDAATGKLRWKGEVYMLYGLPLVAEGKVYIGSVGYGYFVFDALTGQPYNRLDVGIIKGNPAYAHGTIYTGAEWQYLFAFSAADGAQQWYIPFVKTLVATSPTVSGDTLFFTSYDSLYAYSTTTQQQFWAHRLSYFSAYAGNPFVYKGMMYVGSTMNYIYAMDAATGEEKWKTGPFVYGVTPPSPVVANGTLYTGSADNYFYAYDAATGAVKWQFQMQGAAMSGACITDMQGNVYHPVESGEQN